jgi:ATP-binding cassette, subfamily F, member 3
MLINLRDVTKKIGSRTLFEGLTLTIQSGEKVGLIGRNGAGKSTLQRIISGEDHGYSGEIDRRRGLVLVATAQEHAQVADQPVIEYLLDGLPEYADLKHQIDTPPGAEMDEITSYTSAVQRFSDLGYYDIEERVITRLAAYQIYEEQARGPIGQLSGGQKRFVELVKVTMSGADLALIDEPTNHMDYAAKSDFIDWLRASGMAVLVITHDRDVLASADRVVELRSGTLVDFPGNYEDYLRQNGLATAREIETYEQGQKRLVRIEKQIKEAGRRKAGWSGTADKTNPFMLLERRLTKEKDALLEQLKKPAFWIDRETLEKQNDKVVAKYEKYKAKNIRLQTGGAHQSRLLIKATKLSLGYDHPLFAGVNLSLAVGQRLEVRGRNGVGKTTLIKEILAQAAGEPAPARLYAGEIEIDKKTSIGLYEQEISPDYLELPLGRAVLKLHERAGQPINEAKVRSLLSQYLFDPQAHTLPLERLSGGEKARFQLIKMLIHRPNLLILDEPTNHLDLPSIEELEEALMKYEGAILYVSHDSYFSRNMGGDVVQVEPVASEEPAAVV